MTTPKDGGPAFPRGSQLSDNDGMSLRDWFAGTVKEEELWQTRSIVDCKKALGMSDDEPWTEDCYYRLLARNKFKYADAMLAEREKGE